MKIAAVREYALGLPDVTEEPHFRHSSFRVRGKIFVTVPPEETHVHVFVGEQHREPALEMYPGFIDKLTWGARVVGLRVALATARPSVVAQLVRQAWESKAPKALREKISTR
ncbi:MmcQ/YjbR family DNA-binding protein [Rudaea sp.]|uniref:MmcQ/YjbR family DNA-binding protein n=1 Tax=Rudaea sp. TaxID=2136325 RepID=UPI0032201BD5